MNKSLTMDWFAVQNRELCSYLGYELTLEPMPVCPDNYRLFIRDGSGVLVYERWYYDTKAQAKQAAMFWCNRRERAKA